MASDVRPPITEVVVSVAFDSQSCLVGPQLLITLSELISEFSRIEEQPPYEMPIELPLEQMFSRPVQPPFRIVGSPGTLEHRYWLFDPIDDSLLVQVQSNYFAMNWRRTKNPDSYIGFETLMDRFESVMHRIQSAVLSNGGADLALKQAEISYINTIRPDSFWSDHNDVSKVVSIRVPSIDNLDQLTMAYSKSIHDDNGVFRGRLHSVIQTGYEAGDDDTSVGDAVRSGLVPIINISTHVRSTKLSQPSTDVMIDFLRDGHIQAGETFVAVTTDSARDYWGI